MKVTSNSLSSISVPIAIMFHLLPRNLLFPTSRCSFSSSSPQLRTLHIPFPVRQFSSSPPSSPPFRHWTKDYNLMVSVCWDFETCPVPSGVCYSKVAPSITGVLRINGFKGPIQIEAYGNVYQLSDINQQKLSSTGVDLHHIPGGRINSGRSLMDWIYRIPPRSHILLISGDRDLDFKQTLNRLRSCVYSFLFACPERVDPDIRYASTIMWHWSNILEGKCLENLADLDDDS